MGHISFPAQQVYGLDGEIARRANALPSWLRAHGGYAFSLAPALLQFSTFWAKAERTRGREYRGICPAAEHTAMAAVFANTPVYGGGMRVAPNAKMDDGQLDVCLIGNINKLKLAGVFPTVYFRAASWHPAKSSISRRSECAWKLIAPWTSHADGVCVPNAVDWGRFRVDCYEWW